MAGEIHKWTSQVPGLTWGLARAVRCADEVCAALSGVTEGDELGQQIVSLTAAGRALAAKLATVDSLHVGDTTPTAHDG
jgi:hypothetical protein